MRPEIESARKRLESILCELEQCCTDEETFSPRLVQEAHALVRVLHEQGYNMATRRQDNSTIVDIEEMQVESFAG
jgi:hypothetical protein